MAMHDFRNASSIGEKAAGPLGWLSSGLLISRDFRGTSRVGRDKSKPPMHDYDSVATPISYCLDFSIFSQLSLVPPTR